LLQIEPFDKSQLQHTSYYFRLSPVYAERNSEEWRHLAPKGRNFALQPGEYLRVQSQERFHLSDKIFGLIGPDSEISKGGLRFVHAPFVDPLYDGPLMFGIHNCFGEVVTIEVGCSIGKIVFFNTSDTYPVRLRPLSASERKFNERSKIREESKMPGLLALEEDIIPFSHEKEDQEGP
jgi:deoxycytidine triphosphate deaminase